MVFQDINLLEYMTTKCLKLAIVIYKNIKKQMNEMKIAIIVKKGMKSKP